MEKILIIHNEYKERGGEDIAVEDEIKFLSNHFEVDTILLLNKIERPYSQFLSFLTLNNPESNKLIKKKIDEFAPDIIYIHNTWFKASLGIFKTLEEYGVPIFLKLHNFRYFCTKAIFFKKHLINQDFCPACGIKNNGRIFNKYFTNSVFKSLAVINYGIKYFRIIKSHNLKLFVLTEFHKAFLEKLKISSERIYVFPNSLNIPTTDTSYPAKEKYFIYAGRISEEKGLKELCESFLSANLEGVKLKIVGEGPYLKKLKKEYSSNSLQFYGYLPNEEVLNLISTSLGVITATKLYEGQPTLLCEASLLGVLSIFPNNGGIKEFFPPDYPYSFEISKKGDITYKLIDFYKDYLTNQDLMNSNKKFLTNKLDNEILLEKFKKVLKVS